MKFKTIFILFNCVIIISFLIIYLMPLFMLGWEYTSVFWAKNWFLPVIFVLVIGGLNGYFIANWKLFKFLEAEDWDSLKSYLEDQVFGKRRLRQQFVRVLVNAYLVRSEVDKIRELEGFIRENRKELLAKNVMLFSIPYILANDSAAMKEYFGPFTDSVKGRDGQWVRWGYAFSCFLGEQKEDAKKDLLALAGEVKDPVLLALSLYMLDAFSGDDGEAKKVVEQKGNQLRDSYNRSSWDKEIEKSKNDIFKVIITKLIQESGRWLFQEKDARGEGNREMQ